MKYTDREKAKRLRQRIAEHDRVGREAEHFLNTVDAQVERLHLQVASLLASIEPMKAKSRRATTLKAKNKTALDKLFGKVNTEEKLTRYKRKIRELEREIANG